MSLRTDLALDALEMALWARGKALGRAHPPAPGPGGPSRRSSSRLRSGAHFWNDRRLYSACGDAPPAEFEAAYHQRLQVTIEAA